MVEIKDKLVLIFYSNINRMSTALKSAHAEKSISPDKLRSRLRVMPPEFSMISSAISMGPAFTFNFEPWSARSLSISREQVHVLGYRDHQLQQVSLLSFLRLVHLDDRKALLNGIRQIKKQLSCLRQKNEVSVHFGIDFRCYHKNGSSLRLMMQCVLVEADRPEHGFRCYGICTDIDHFKPQGHVALYYQDSSGKELRISNLNQDKSKISFSRREFDVLKLLAQGLTSREIEEQLNISQHTVRTHRRNMHRKCKVDTTAQLVKLAINEGYI